MSRYHLFCIPDLHRSIVGTTYKPVVTVKRKAAHKHAVSAVSYYPVDPAMFISSSYDATVKVWDAEEMIAAHTFSLEESVSSIAMDPIGRHTLVAASAGQNVRLLDLASGYAVGWLMGAPKETAHTAVAWSPKEEHLCAPSLLHVSPWTAPTTTSQQWFYVGDVPSNLRARDFSCLLYHGAGSLPRTKL